MTPAFDDCWNRIGIGGNRSCPELTRHIQCRNCPVYSAAARALLDVPKSEDDLKAVAEYFAMPAGTPPTGAAKSDIESIVVFRVRAEWLAIRTAMCQEIADGRKIHSLPHCRSNSVLGLANVRGDLLICLSLAALLGVTGPHRPVQASGRGHITPSRLLVVQWKENFVGFPVDEVRGIERIRSRDLKALPSTAAHGKASCMQALLTLDARTVGLLNAELLLSAAEHSLA